MMVKISRTRIGGQEEEAAIWIFQGCFDLRCKPGTFNKMGRVYIRPDQVLVEEVATRQGYEGLYSHSRHFLVCPTS